MRPGLEIVSLDELTCAEKVMFDTPNHAAATEYLANLDADWARLVDKLGACTHQPRPEREPYEALVRAVAYQQLHSRPAEAILGRLVALHRQFPTPDQMLSLDVETLRGCGFSTRKITTLKALASGAINGLVPDRETAENLPEDELITRLTQLPGIGRWTVEMLLIYTLDRPDIFPADDFGLRAGYRFLKSLDELPSRKTLERAALAFSPHRTVAAWYLWRALELPEYQIFKQTLK